MPQGEDVGDAYVEIHADGSGLTEEVQRAATKAAKEAKTQVEFQAKFDKRDLKEAVQEAAASAERYAKVNFTATFASKELKASVKAAAAEASNSAKVKFDPTVSIVALRKAMRDAARAVDGSVNVRFGATIRRADVNRAAKAVAAESTATINFDAKFNEGQLRASIESATLRERPKIEVDAELNASQLLAKAKAAAKLASDEAEVQFRFDRQGFAAEGASVKAQVDALLADINPVEFNAQLDAKGLMAQAKAAVAAVEAENEVEFRLDRAGFAGDLADVEGMVAALQADLEANPLSFRVEMDQARAAAELNASLRGIERTVEPLKVGVGFDLKATELIAKTKAAIREAEAFATIHAHLDTKGFSFDFDHGTFRNAAGDVAQLSELVSGLGDAFDDMGKESESALGGLGKNISKMRIFGTNIVIIGAALAALISALPFIWDLAGALVALAGSITIGAVGTAISFAGALGAIGVGALAVKVGMSGVGDALKAYNDVQDEIATTGKASAATLKKQEEAFKNIAPAARDAVVAISKFQRAWTEEVVKPVQQNLFGGDIARDIDNLGKNLLPALSKGLSGIATEVNSAADGFLKWAGSESTASGLTSTLGKLRPILRDMLDFIGDIGSGLGTLFIGSLPSAKELSGSIKSVGESFKGWATSVTKNGKFQKFLEDAREDAKLLWSILGNVVGIIAKVFSAGDDTGRGFLASIDKYTQKLDTFLSTPEGKEKLAAWFDGAEQAIHEVYDIIVILEPLLSGLFGLLNDNQNSFAGFAHDLATVLGGADGGDAGKQAEEAKKQFAALHPDGIDLGEFNGHVLVHPQYVIPDESGQPSVVRGIVVGAVGTNPLAPVTVSQALTVNYEIVDPDENRTAIANAIAEATGSDSATPGITPVDVKVPVNITYTGAGTMPGLTEPILTTVGHALAGITGVIVLWSVQNAAKIGRAIWDFLNELGFEIAAGLNSIFQQMIDDTIALPGMIGTALQQAWSSYSSYADQIVQGISDAFTNYDWYGVILGVAKLIISPFTWLYDQLVGHSIIPDLIDEIVRLFETLPGRIVTALGDILTPFTTWLSGLPGAAEAIVRRVVAAFVGLAQHIIDTAGDLAGRFATWLSTLPGKAQDIARRIVQAFGNLAEKIISGAGDLAAKFGAWGDAAWERMKSVPGKIVGLFSGLAQKIVDKVGTIELHAPTIDTSGITAKIGSLLKKLAEARNSAKGGVIVNGAQVRTVGEAGPEAIVPLRKGAPLDPGVTALLLQVAAQHGIGSGGGSAPASGGGGSVRDIIVQLPTGDPEAAAMAVMNRLATAV